MVNLSEGGILKQKKNGGWLIIGGARYIGSHISVGFSRLNLPLSVIDYGKNKIEARPPIAALKFFGNIRSNKDLVPKFVGRREVDIGIVVVDPSKTERLLRFKGKHNLTEVVASVL